MDGHVEARILGPALVWGPVTGVLGLLCAIPVALVVAMTIGGRSPDGARRWGVISGAAATAAITASLTALVSGWDTPLWAAWVVLVAAAVAGLTMGHSAARIARRASLEPLAHPAA